MRVSLKEKNLLKKAKLFFLKETPNGIDNFLFGRITSEVFQFLLLLFLFSLQVPPWQRVVLSCHVETKLIG